MHIRLNSFQHSESCDWWSWGESSNYLISHSSNEFELSAIKHSLMAKYAKSFVFKGFDRNVINCIWELFLDGTKFQQKRIISSIIIVNVSISWVQFLGLSHERTISSFLNEWANCEPFKNFPVPLYGKWGLEFFSEPLNSIKFSQVYRV